MHLALHPQGRVTPARLEGRPLGSQAGDASVHHPTIEERQDEPHPGGEAVGLEPGIREIGVAAVLVGRAVFRDAREGELGPVAGSRGLESLSHLVDLALQGREHGAGGQGRGQRLGGIRLACDRGLRRIESVRGTERDAHCRLELQARQAARLSRPHRRDLALGHVHFRAERVELRHDPGLHAGPRHRQVAPCSSQGLAGRRLEPDRAQLAVVGLHSGHVQTARVIDRTADIGDSYDLGARGVQQLGCI